MKTNLRGRRMSAKDVPPFAEGRNPQSGCLLAAKALFLALAVLILNIAIWGGLLFGAVWLIVKALQMTGVL